MAKSKVMAITAFLISVLFWNAVVSQGLNGIEEVSRLIGNRECVSAEAYGRRNFQRPMLYTVLGMIQLDCKNDKKSAIEFFKLAARENEFVALEMLIKLGENASDIGRVVIEQAPQLVENPPMAIALPPEHTLSRMPAQRLRPQPVIIVRPQTQYVIVPNINACIQDGGPIFCPRYPFRH